MNYEINVIGHTKAFDLAYNYCMSDNIKDYAIISIQDHIQSLMGIRFKAGGKCKAALNIHFSDIDTDLNNYNKKFFGQYKGELEAMTSGDAKRILRFITSLDRRSDIENLYVQCNVGASRSPAVAAAIALLHGKDDRAYFQNKLYEPNMFVYKTILKESYKFKDAEVDEIVREKIEIHKLFMLNDTNNLVTFF